MSRKGAVHRPANNLKAKRARTRSNGAIILSKMDKAIPRDVLATALEQFRDDKRIDALVAALFSPAYAKHKLSTLCSNYGIPFHEVTDAFRRAKLDEGMLRMMAHVPEVMEDVAEDAKSRLKTCPACSGTKKVREAPCPECSGTGSVRVPGDTASRNLVFESIGLKGQRGPLIAQQFNNLSGDESLEDLMRAAKPIFDAPALPAPEDKR